MNTKYTDDDNFNELIEKFNYINSKGYIKGINNNANSCGLTFEKELGKNADSAFLPDFKDIEIKCKQKGSRFGIKMFSLAFNGPFLYESYYILKKYGKEDKELPGKNTMYIKLKYGKKVLYNNHYFELGIDYENQLLFMNIYDINLKFLGKRGYILFDILKNRVDLKTKKLAYISVYRKKLNNDVYFKYYQISCYKSKGFDVFLKMIEEGIIKCTLSLRYSKSKNTYGKNKSSGVMFFIAESNMEKIFEKIYFDKR